MLVLVREGTAVVAGRRSQLEAVRALPRPKLAGLKAVVLSALLLGDLLREFGSARKRFHAQSARHLAGTKGREFDRTVKLKDKLVWHRRRSRGPLLWRRPAPM